MNRADAEITQDATPRLAGSIGPAIFLSPHYDDVVLSCGGTVAALTAAGAQPLMVTIFGGEIPEELVDDFARWKHERWGYRTAEDVLAVRRAEDAAAAAVLGCQTRWLGHFDAIYRGDRYTKDNALYGQPHMIEFGLVDFIADEVLRLPERQPETIVYVPLGIGDHVDHQITFAAGQKLASQGITVFAYEDCPYAIHSPHRVAPRLEAVAGKIGPLQPVPTAETLQQRIKAIEAYTTQLPVIFRFTNDMPGAITAHALEAGNGIPAERYWSVLPLADSQ